MPHLDPAETLQRLVATPSVNPMGKDVSQEAASRQCFEHRVTNFLASCFGELALPCERHVVHPAGDGAPARENIIARLDSGSDRPTLMLEVHQDTVPVDGMTIDPFAGELRDGRIYGRGACDVKGAMACILAAISRLVDKPSEGMPNIVIACSVNEEHGFTGAQQLARLWQSGDSKLLPHPPDAIIVSEPTELNIVVAHKGVVRWRCTARGRAAHSSDPSQGDNAIYRMAEVVRRLKNYAEEIAPQRGEHPLLGRPTLSVGTVAGGISVNTVPDRCHIEIDRRILPEEEPQAAYKHVIDFLASELGDDADAIEHSEPYIVARGLNDQRNAALASQLQAAAQHSGGSAETIGVPFGTDASAFGSKVPTVVFGPGSIAQAHTEDEWIAVEQLHQAADILGQFCRTFTTSE